MPAQDGNHFNHQYSQVDGFFTDCQFHGGTFQVLAPGFVLTNCLLERVGTSVSDDGWGSISASFRNCTLFGGYLYLTHWESGNYVFRDNLFDHTTIYQDCNVDIDAAYDGYSTGSTRLTPTNANDVVTSLTFKAGPLGNFYYTNNCAFLNAGST